MWLKKGFIISIHFRQHSTVLWRGRGLDPWSPSIVLIYVYKDHRRVLLITEWRGVPILCPLLVLMLSKPLAITPPPAPAPPLSGDRSVSYYHNPVSHNVSYSFLSLGRNNKVKEANQLDQRPTNQRPAFDHMTIIDFDTQLQCSALVEAIDWHWQGPGVEGDNNEHDNSTGHWTKITVLETDHRAS